MLEETGQYDTQDWNDGIALVFSNSSFLVDEFPVINQVLGEENSAATLWMRNFWGRKSTNYQMNQSQLLKYLQQI
jgi:hypothetical protein